MHPAPIQFAFEEATQTCWAIFVNRIIFFLAAGLFRNVSLLEENVGGDKLTTDVPTTELPT